MSTETIYDPRDSMGETFKWLVAENKAFQDENFSLKVYPRHPLYHLPLPKSQKELICGAKVIESPEAPEDRHW